MNLICTYTDNKHLIEKEDDEVQEEDEKATRAVDHLKLRCDILEKEKRNTATMLAKQRKNKQVISEVLEKLTEQKNKNAKETTALEEESKLI